MGRAPCCDKANVKRGPWSPEEDAKLKEYIEKYGTGGNWIALPQKAGLKRCGKSCRLRWLNYLRPNIKHGEFSDDEDKIICSLFANIGSRWSIIAAQLPGRTDNDIKNYWNTKLKKKLMGFFPPSQRKSTHQATLSSLLQSSSSSSSSSTSSFNGSRSSYYNTAAAGSFPGLEPISFTPNILFSSNCSPNAAEFLQAQENLVVPIQNYHVNMFGSEPSCSSSDGSHSKEAEYGEQMGLQNCFYNGVEENQRFMVSIGEETTQLDYGLEEIKQLISSSSSCNNHFLFDENKTGERFMYY